VIIIKLIFNSVCAGVFVFVGRKMRVSVILLLFGFWQVVAQQQLKIKSSHCEIPQRQMFSKPSEISYFLGYAT